MDEIKKSEYSSLLKEIEERINSAQYSALKTVNKKLMNLYWDIGQVIVNRQEGKTWGKAVVVKLAEDLRLKFPGVKGFSARNIWKMRSLHLAYRDNPKLPSLMAEIGWTHNTVILEKCKNNQEREFYIRMTRKFGWTVRVLIHQIDNKTFEKTITNKTSFSQTLPKSIKMQAKLAVKDEYIFDFLELGEDHNERLLQKALLSRMQLFLNEMGGLFAFVGSQYRLQVEDQEYFIDILLYHRHLQCLVALELKVGSFKPEYVGKMQFYLSVLDDMVKTDYENPSIGIILCKTRKKAVVEYALKSTKGPMGVAQYQILKNLPEDLKDKLPSLEQVEQLLGDID